MRKQVVLNETTGSGEDNPFRLGGHYMIEDYSFFYVMESKTKTKSPVFLMQETGCGKYMDCREYLKEMPPLWKLCNRWEGIIRSIQMPSLRILRSEPGLKKKMKQAIRAHEKPGPRFAWLRDESEEDHGVWCMDERGELYVGKKDGNGIYCFLLTINPFKITLEDGRIVRKTK